MKVTFLEFIIIMFIFGITFGPVVWLGGNLVDSLEAQRYLKHRIEQLEQACPKADK